MLSIFNRLVPVQGSNLLYELGLTPFWCETAVVAPTVEKLPFLTLLYWLKFSALEVPLESLGSEIGASLKWLF